MYNCNNNISKCDIKDTSTKFSFHIFPECIKRDFTSWEDYFNNLHTIIKNDKETVQLFVEFL